MILLGDRSTYSRIETLQGKLAVMVKNENTRNALLNMLAFSRKI